jgi:signal transduction histidine kinase
MVAQALREQVADHPLALGSEHVERIARDVRVALCLKRQQAELTAQPLAFSRQQVLRPEVSDMNAVVGETVTMLERLLGEDVLLESLLDPELAPILIARSQLAQVIRNLAVNARDAMVFGGHASDPDRKLHSRRDICRCAWRGCCRPIRAPPGDRLGNRNG